MPSPEITKEANRAKRFAETNAGKRILVTDACSIAVYDTQYEAIVVGYKYNSVGIRLLDEKFEGHNCIDLIFIKGYEHLFVKERMFWLFINNKDIKIKILDVSKEEIKELITALEL